MRGRVLGRHRTVRVVMTCAALWLGVGPGPATAGAGQSVGVDGTPWQWPLDGNRTVSRPFDPPSTRYGPGHRGADLPGAVGAPVHAAGAGRVAFAGLLAGRGVVVVVHGELRTTYEPVAAAVSVGQQLEAGTVIGRLTAGHLGCPGSCLHWGLLRGTVYLDPVRLVRAGPSRLLPLSGPVPVAAPLTRPASPEGVPSRRRAGPAAAPASAPAWDLRAADAAWGAGALLALAAGLALVRRSSGPPGRGPAAPSMAASARPPAAGRREPAAPGRPSPQVADLASERQLRRREVA